MKTGILTYYGVHNHGAVLQANALKKVLEDMGCIVSFLPFTRNYDMIPQENSKKYVVGLSSIPFYFKYTLKKGMGNILYNLKKNRTLKRYRAKNLPMGERYSDFTGDLVVIGSDEVFALDVGINPFFFGHGIKAEKVISYAGSFGSTTMEFIQSNNLSALVRSGLESMSVIGVRDANSQMIANSLAGKSSVMVCDPVILYGYEKEQITFVPKEKNYVLVYAYDRNMNAPEEVEQIKKYARKHHLKIYSVGYHHKWCDKNINATPEEVLGYIRNSALVVTDTFHGSVMSLICNTKFVAKIRENQNKLGFLLQEYEAADRIINSFDDFEAVADTPMNYEHIHAIIERRRAESKQFLYSAIGD